MTGVKHRILPPPAPIGIVGGGQLGKMITSVAKRMGYHVTILDPTPASPAGQVADAQIVASFMDARAIGRLAESCQVLTYEFEHINAGILVELAARGHRVYPSGRSLKHIQDKYAQKTMLREAGVPVPGFFPVASERDVLEHLSHTGLPAILKAREGGYDGKGNCVIAGRDEIKPALDQLAGRRLMLEQFIPFERELSTIIVRNLAGDVAFYPVVENLHEQSILRLTRAPAAIPDEIRHKAWQVAAQVMTVLDDYGVFCIEMFLTAGGDIYVNEIAPRPHNSGHYTIEACVTSQFEQVVRVITGMPLGSTQLRSPAVMVNVLGNAQVDGAYTFMGVEDVLAQADTHLHLYGKHSTRALKKIGHITALGESTAVAERRALEALRVLSIVPAPV